MEATTPCKVVGRACMHRRHSGISASSSGAPRPSSLSFSGRLSTSCWIPKFPNSTALEKLVASLAQNPVSLKHSNVLPPRPSVRQQRLRKNLNSSLKLIRGEIGLTSGILRRRTGLVAVGRFEAFDDLSSPSKDLSDGLERLDVGKLWNPSQARHFVYRESSGGLDSVQNGNSSRSRSAFFAAISAQTYQPPVQVQVVQQRSQVSNYVTGGVLLSVGAWTLWVITRTEQYARKALVSPEETLVTPPPAPEMVEQFERAKASVAQAALVNHALAAVRNNDLIKCTVEMELALEENRIARTSIESDFFDEGEIYRGVLKLWLDGYPLDYGKILQLRGLLDIPSKDAEELEQEVQLQSDAYVI